MDGKGDGRFRSLFDYNIDAVLLIGADGIIKDANRAVSRFGSLVPEQVIGRHFRDFVDVVDLSEHEDRLRRAFGGETQYYRSRAHALDGGTFDIVITTIPVVHDGRVVEAMTIVRDETPQRRAAVHIEEQDRALAESEGRFRSLFANNPNGVIALNRNGVVTDVNDAALRLGKFRYEQVVGARFDDFVAPDQLERVSASFWQAMRGEPLTFEMHSFGVDGSPLFLETTVIPMYSEGDVVGVFCVVHDIGERLAAERRAEAQSSRIRNLYFIAASGDQPEVRIRASLAMGCSSFGLSTGAVVDVGGGLPRIEAIFHARGLEPAADAVVLAIAAEAAAQPSGDLATAVPHGMAARLDAANDASAVLVFCGPDDATPELESTDSDLLGLIATLVGGTIDRTNQRERLRAMAYYDTLTRLPNRVFFAEKLRDAIEVAQSRYTGLALLFLDLDRFKDVNETVGHARGDRLLQLVAQRLLNEVGDRGTVARMGGDEFVVLLAACDAAEARAVAERIIASLSEPFESEDHEHFISTSVGIAIYPEDGRDEQTLIKNADIAMYRAKDRGRNGYFFYDAALESPILMRLSQERLLRRALDLGEFVVFYQPQVDLRTHRVVSVEALLRWNHPKSGLISPGHFIPSAEASGLIVPLGDWVLRTAAAQVRAWHAALGPIRLAVNLSGRQFYQRDLRSSVIDGLASARLDPAFLELEITESVAMSDAAQTIGIVRDLKAEGIRIAVDDFGTGYSSLAYLRRFALDVLKIDGSFVVGVGRESFDETIVKTVIGMAHSLGLEVVAEGVETSGQYEFLQRHDCDMAQGYSISEPLPAHEFERFFAGYAGPAATHAKDGSR